MAYVRVETLTGSKDDTRRRRDLGLVASLSGMGLSAQQVGDNINVLPVFQGIDQFDFLRGDLDGQRQQEPSIVVSSLKRTTSRCSTTTSARSTYPTIRRCRASEQHVRRAGVGRHAEPVCEAVGVGTHARKGAPVVALEAGIGMSVSYDGGLTWTGGFMPGLPFDQSPASVKSPGFGLEGMSDPVAISAPCGKFYVAYLQFSRITRQSKLMVARFQDLNDHDLRHTFKFLGSSVIETGMNSRMATSSTSRRWRCG